MSTYAKNMDYIQSIVGRNMKWFESFLDIVENTKECGNDLLITEIENMSKRTIKYLLADAKDGEDAWDWDDTNICNNGHGGY